MKWLRSVVGQIAGCGIFHRKCNIQSEATATVYFLTEYEGRTHFALLVRLFSYLFSHFSHNISISSLLCDVRLLLSVQWVLSAPSIPFLQWKVLLECRWNPTKATKRKVYTGWYWARNFGEPLHLDVPILCICGFDGVKSYQPSALWS